MGFNIKTGDFAAARDVKEHKELIDKSNPDDIVELNASLAQFERLSEIVKVAAKKS